jgi:hypothetical protein
LPGPVLGPALALKPPTDEGQDETEEPRHLADSKTSETIVNHQIEVRERQNAEPPASAKEKHDDEIKTAAVQPSRSKAHETKRPGPSKEVESPSDESPPKADTPLTSQWGMTLMGLFFSVACNVFFLVVVADQRTKYRALVRRTFDAGSPTLAATYDSNIPRWEQLPAPEQQGSSGKPGDELHRPTSG